VVFWRDVCRKCYKIQEGAVWFAGVMFAESAIKYANFQAFETVRLRPPFFCDNALHHRMFAAQIFEFVLWPHVEGSVHNPGCFAVHRDHWLLKNGSLNGLENLWGTTR